MPYPKSHKIETKNRILKSATELFCRYGFERVSISQIMKLARLTHGAFYAHFKSKEELYSASFMEILSRSRAARFAKKSFSIKHLTALVSDYLNLRELARRDDPSPEAILFNEIGSENGKIKKLYEEAYLNLKKALEIRITALSRLKKLPFPADAEVVAEKARTILAALIGAVAIARSIPQGEEQRNILVAAQKQILTILGVDERLVGTVSAPPA